MIFGVRRRVSSFVSNSKLQSKMNPYWLVADMDATIMGAPRRVGKKYVSPKFSESPCFDPICAWLQAGHRLLIVTSDDGHRPFRNLWKCFPSELVANGKVILSTSEGAAMYTGDDMGNALPVEDYVIRKTVEGVPRELSPCLPKETLPKLYAIAAKMHQSWFRDISKDRSLLKRAGMSKHVNESILNVIESAEKIGDYTFTKSLNAENLLAPNTVLSKGTMIWRNQPGPVDGWIGAGDFNKLCSADLEAVFSNLVILNLPQSVSRKYIKEAEVELENLGLSASAAPNSVWIKVRHVSKGLPIQFLVDNFDAFDTARAVAFGDNPLGNDEPLTTVDGLSFVSVANCGVHELPTDLQSCHVGGEENGTAKTIEHLLEIIENREFVDIEAAVIKATQQAREIINKL